MNTWVGRTDAFFARSGRGRVCVFLTRSVLGLLCNPAESTQKASVLPGGGVLRTLRDGRFPICFLLLKIRGAWLYNIDGFGNTFSVLLGFCMRGDFL